VVRGGSGAAAEEGGGCSRGLGKRVELWALGGSSGGKEGHIQFSNLVLSKTKTAQQLTTMNGTHSFDQPTFILVSLAILVGIASLLALLENRCGGSTRGRTFAHSIIAIAMIFQLHLLSEASVRIPNNNSKSVYRWDCLHSGKGGKRPLRDSSDEYLNPCYNRTTDVNGTEAVSHLCSSDSPDDESYIPATRDCDRAQLSHCSLTEPCTPCGLSRRDEFHGSAHGWSRCQACLVSNRFGECNFVAGIGPYCWRDAETWEVVPCEKCCTESVPIIDEYGNCY